METREFVGRGAELEQIQRFLDWDRRGPQVLVVAGPRGVGRSELLSKLKERALGSEFVLLSFSRQGATPGQQARRLFRSALEQLTGLDLDPDDPVGRWLDVLPAHARAALGGDCGELRPGAHPARALRCLIRSLAGLARGLERRLVVALDDPDCYGDAQGYPGVPRRGFPLTKYWHQSPWIRWILTPRHPGSLEVLAGHPEVAVVPLGPLRRADSIHLGALLLESEIRPVPRALLWPLHGFSQGRPGYLRALAARLVEGARLQRGVPGPAEVRTAFLGEVLEPMGRIGLACQARLGEPGRGALDRAMLDVLAGKGALGLESVSQLTGIGRSRALDHLRELTRRGVLREDQGRYHIDDRVLGFRLRALAVAGTPRPWEAPGVRTMAEEFEAETMCPWETRVRSTLRTWEGRALPGRCFGAERVVCCPAGPVEEAAVGFDSRGEVDGAPTLVAADMLLNGRDRRWLVEMPRQPLPYEAAQMQRALRMRDFFARTYRRPIERLLVASEAGFTADARDLARACGVLITDTEALAELERGLLTAVA